MQSNFPTKESMAWKLWLFGILKIPMIAFCRPRLVVWNEEEVVVKIKRKRRTNNHLKSMYFGALMVGADLAAGLHAFAYSVSGNRKISLAFKSCSANFLSRPEMDVFFEMNSGSLVREMILESEKSKERINRKIPVLIKNETGEVVAEVEMELSLKVK